ncbi:hypothetical protein RCL_jg21325.t1 [Rhizophagus clarus]|uniref:Uncharacterized protein n=1 Tax=Rhizophagus clarus TaxID=94130 RepID=A0A8H3LYP8_9GLOM|nr:hypothetical protein RCL_jg21325.t1 [Rhizophagus clarus]
MRKLKEVGSTSQDLNMEKPQFSKNRKKPAPLMKEHETILGSNSPKLQADAQKTSDPPSLPTKASGRKIKIRSSVPQIHVRIRTIPVNNLAFRTGTWNSRRPELRTRV